MLFVFVTTPNLFESRFWQKFRLDCHVGQLPHIEEEEFVYRMEMILHNFIFVSLSCFRVKFDMWRLEKKVKYYKPRTGCDQC
jgi:hypothetical protein